MSTLTNKNNFIIDVPNLGGGRNTKDSNTLISDIEAVDIENFDFEERGAIKKVNGSYKLNTTAIADAPVNSLYEAIKSDGTSHLLAFCGTAIYVSTDGGATFSLLKDGFEANKKWSCYTYADNVIMVNGFDSNQIYDFTAVRDMGLTAPSSAPSTGVGAAGGGSNSASGGGSGGGHIDVFYKTLSGSLTYTLNGGGSGGSPALGGAGGAGSSRATQVALSDLFGSTGFFNFF